MSDPDRDLVEVPVHAFVLRTTADLLELLGDFFAEADPVIRTRLGCYLIDRYGEENTTASVIAAVVILGELSEAAQLLHALAGDDVDQQ